MIEVFADSENGKSLHYFASLQAALLALLKRCFSKDLSLLFGASLGEVAYTINGTDNLGLYSDDELVLRI